MKAVLLDMDGTLVDSDSAVERAWHRWAAEHAVPVDVLTPILHGNPAATTIRVVRPDLDDTAVAAAAQRNLELQYDDLADVTATPGAARLLRTLDELGVPWAVVTSADRRLATARLHAAGLPVRHLVTVEDTPRGKPDPAPYLAGATLLNADPRDCLVVEDSQPGIDAGRAAGMRVAALRGLPGDLRIRDLDELADTFTA
ncbi:HAD-IA family hydrolase [Dactylosporangium sp. NPDC050588]|uniref:HAD-IA family hydrolase n=1 Tax=Dactylosporangium sp. NPDC050588 TaxID=3157211 RepID=UPI0033CDE959